MKLNQRFYPRSAASLLIFTLLLLSVPFNRYAQGQVVDDLGTALAEIEKKVEKLRESHGIPGMSLAIVKDGKVVYAKGLGYKDLEKKLPVTADTQFAIGSTTKAFTALTVLMTQDDGKISLDASPKTVLPYFKMADPETDKAITIRDLLTHSSGLNRTDLAMLTGRLSRRELIMVAGEAKPVSKFKEKFGYQNLMFTVAGETVAVAQKQPWEKFVAERIFKPLQMNNSNLSIAEMERSKDHSLGYNFDKNKKAAEKVPYRPLDAVTPAGAINSSANDMAKWIQFIMNKGEAGGKRLISEKGFEEWFKPQMKVTAAMNYSLGWFLGKWKGHDIAFHGGNIDGFNAQVTLLPDKGLGFVMLSNVTSSPIGDELMPVIFEGLTTKPASPGLEAANSVPAEKEAGTYRLEAAGVDFEIKWTDGKLMAHIPGQPAYVLENVTGRKYKLAGAPDGLFITFKDSELYLEQPHGNFTLPKRDGPVKMPVSEAAKELIGTWRSETSDRNITVKETENGVTLNIEGQQPYTLIDRAKDEFKLSPLPESFWLRVTRGDDGKVVRISSVQPEGEFGFKPAAEFKPSISVNDLNKKAIEAAGGDAKLRELSSRIIKTSIDMVNQGVKGTTTNWMKSGNRTATETTLTALGKDIAYIWEYFDGNAGEEAFTFAPLSKYAGKRLADVKIGADLHSMFDWDKKFKRVEIVRETKVGDEDTYVVEFEPESGSKFVDYFSKKTFLVLKRDGSSASSTGDISIPYTIFFSDYRDIDGLKIPFRMVFNSVSNGDVISTVTEVKHNVPIEDSVFTLRKLRELK